MSIGPSLGVAVVAAALIHPLLPLDLDRGGLPPRSAPVVESDSPGIEAQDEPAIELAEPALVTVNGFPISPAADPVVYTPPTTAGVVDHFRPPTTFAGAGNRGLTYGTVPGADVFAAADGTVVFAGPIGTHSYVTVVHGDGVRTSYAFLAEVLVTAGWPVRSGDALGVTGNEPFHLGARIGDTYIDPALLFSPEDYAAPGRGGAATRLSRAVLVPGIPTG